MAREKLAPLAEEEAQAGADEERRREDAADRAGAEGRGGRENFKDENDGERLPDPFAARGWRSPRCSRCRKPPDGRPRARRR